MIIGEVMNELQKNYLCLADTRRIYFDDVFVYGRSHSPLSASAAIIENKAFEIDTVPMHLDEEGTITASIHFQQFNESIARMYKARLQNLFFA